MATPITAENNQSTTPSTENNVTQKTVLSTDPSDIKNGVNGFNLTKCSSPKETTAVIYIPNMGYGIPLNVYLSNKVRYEIGETVNDEPTFEAKTDTSISSYSFSRKDFSYEEKTPSLSGKLINHMMSITEDAEIDLSVDRVFQPRNIRSKHFATSVTLNSPCTKKYTLNQDLELPTQIFVKDVISDGSKEPYTSLFDMPAYPFGIDTFEYIAGESQYTKDEESGQISKMPDEYGRDILNRDKKSSHMPIRRGEGVLSDIYSHLVTRIGEFSAIKDSQDLGCYCLLGHELVESLKTELLLKGTVEAATLDLSEETGYFPSYNDLQLMGIRGYTDTYPAAVTAVDTVRVIDSQDFDEAGNVSTTYCIEHPINSFYAQHFNQETDLADQPSILDQMTSGLSTTGKDVLRFTTPSVLVAGKMDDGTTRFYTSDEFTRDVLKSIGIFGVSTPPRIQTAGFGKHVITDIESDQLIMDLKEARIYKWPAGGTGETQEYYDTYNVLAEILKGTKSETFPSIIKSSELDDTTSWLYTGNTLVTEATTDKKYFENILVGEYRNDGTFNNTANAIVNTGGIASVAIDMCNLSSDNTVHADITSSVAKSAKVYSSILVYLVMVVYPILDKAGTLLTAVTEDTFSFPESDSAASAITDLVSASATELTETIQEYASYGDSKGFSVSNIRGLWTQETNNPETNILSSLSNIDISIDRVETITDSLSKVVTLLELDSAAGITIADSYLADTEIVSDSRSLISSGNRYYYKSDSTGGDIDILPGTGGELEVDDECVSTPLNYMMTSSERKTFSDKYKDIGNIFITGSTFTGKSMVATGTGLNVLDIKNVITTAMAADRSSESMPELDVTTLVSIVENLNRVCYAIDKSSFFVPVDNPIEYSKSDLTEYLINTRSNLISQIDLVNKKLKYIIDEAKFVDTEGTVEYTKSGHLFSDTANPSTEVGTISDKAAAALDIYYKYFDAVDPLTDSDVAGDMSDKTVYKQAMYLSYMFNMCKLLEPMLNDISPVLTNSGVFQGNSKTLIETLTNAKTDLYNEVINLYKTVLQDSFRLATIYLYSLEMILSIGDRLMMEAIFSNENILVSQENGGTFGSYFGYTPKQLYNLHIFHFMTSDGEPIYPIVETDNAGTYPTLDGLVSFRDITSLCSYNGEENRGLYYKITMESPYYNEGEFKLNPVIFTGINRRTGFWNCFSDPVFGEEDSSSIVYSDTEYNPLYHRAEKTELVDRDRTVDNADFNMDVSNLLYRVQRSDQKPLMTYSMSDLWNEEGNKIDSPILLEAKIEGKLNVSSTIASSMKIVVTARDSTVAIADKFKTDMPSKANFDCLKSGAEFEQTLVATMADTAKFTEASESEDDSYKKVMRTIHSEKMLTYLLWDSLDKTNAAYYKSVFTLGTTSYTINSAIATKIASSIKFSDSKFPVYGAADSLFVIPVLGIVLENITAIDPGVRAYISAEVIEKFQVSALTFVPHSGRGTTDREVAAQKLAYAMNYNQALSLHRSVYSTYRSIDTYTDPGDINDLFSSGKIQANSYNNERDTVAYTINALCLGISGLFSPATLEDTSKEADRIKQQTMTSSVGMFTTTSENGFPLGSSTIKAIINETSNDETSKLYGSLSISKTGSVEINNIASSTIICPSEYLGSTGFIPYNITPEYAHGATPNQVLGRIYLQHILGFLALSVLNDTTTTVERDVTNNQYIVKNVNGVEFTISFQTPLNAAGVETGVYLPVINFIRGEKPGSMPQAFYDAFDGNEVAITTEIGTFLNQQANLGNFADDKAFKTLIIDQVESATNSLIGSAIDGTNSAVAYYITSRKFTPAFADGEGTAAST